MSIIIRIGALVTYIINILRIATIFTTTMDYGDGSLYSITWVIAYPLIMLASQRFWTIIKTRITGSPISQLKQTR